MNKAGDPAQIAEYRRIAATLDRAIPLYNVAGNHDVGNEPTPASVAAYVRDFGPDRYTLIQGTSYPSRSRSSNAFFTFTPHR